jgi:hypothetical protein
MVDAKKEEVAMPAVGVSLILIAVGAILAFAVTTAVEGVLLPTVGVILMAVGGLGLLIALVYMMTLDTGHEVEHDVHNRHL